MFGEVEGSLSAGLPRLYSTDLPSRISSNSLKTNDGRHGYPSRNREDNFPVLGALAAKNPLPFFHRGHQE